LNWKLEEYGHRLRDLKDRGSEYPSGHEAVTHTGVGHQERVAGGRHDSGPAEEVEVAATTLRVVRKEVPLRDPLEQRSTSS
jgi:hypothetical protein